MRRFLEILLSISAQTARQSSASYCTEKRIASLFLSDTWGFQFGINSDCGLLCLQRRVIL